MVVLFGLGILLLAWKLMRFAWKAAWGIAKGVVFVLAAPALLVALLVAGLIYLAVPLLIVALLAAFIWPMAKGK